MLARMAQTLTSLLIHIVFSTKHREDAILPAIERDMHRYMNGIAKALESPLLVSGGTANHVHLLVSMSKNIALSELVMNVKKDSSKWIKTRDVAASRFRWQDGYAAFSIGESGHDALAKYIRTQKEHHRRVSYEDEVRAPVRKYKVVEFEEKYAWDLRVACATLTGSQGKEEEKGWVAAFRGRRNGRLPATIALPPAISCEPFGLKDKGHSFEAATGRVRRG
jgi:REP element-mobilizing transposase RayT